MNDLLFFFKMNGKLINKLKKFDAQLLKKFYLSRIGEFLPLKLLIFMGDGPFWLLILGISAILGIFAEQASFIKLSMLILMGFSLAQLAFIPSKLFIKRRRPYANTEMQKSIGIVIENRDPGHGSKEMESFPSGHLYWTTMCVIFISYQFSFSGIIISGWMIPVMFYLRLYLGVHYPSDALAGLFMGLATAVLAILVLPAAFAAHQSVMNFKWYPVIYLMVILLFIIGGYRSWLKRV